MELQFKNVTKAYGDVHAVDHVTHSMEKGVYSCNNRFMLQIRSGVNDCIYFIAGQNGRKIALSFHSRDSVIIPDSLQHLFI